MDFYKGQTGIFMERRLPLGKIVKEHIIHTKWGTKTIKVFCGDVTQIPESFDLLVCSAFKNDYIPTYSSMIGILYRKYGISVAELSRMPFLDLKSLGVWISTPLDTGLFKRIGCVEILDCLNPTASESELRSLYDTLFFAVKKSRFFGFPITSMAMRVLGTGDQQIAFNKSLAPLLTECISALKSIEELRTVILFERNNKRCQTISETISGSASDVGDSMVFISYSHHNQDIANFIANGLEECGIKPWIDHRMIRCTDFGKDITLGISESKVFLLLVSSYSMKSPDVLRELRNAGWYADRNGLIIYPVLLEKIHYPPEYAYYLTGLEYKNISKPPQEEKILSMCRDLRYRLGTG